MRWDLRQIVNVSRPGETPAPGDDIEIETVGGWVREVDPVTRQATDRRQRFRLEDDGVIAPTQGNVR